jgi:hypothetical protein
MSALEMVKCYPPEAKPIEPWGWSQAGLRLEDAIIAGDDVVAVAQAADLLPE